MILFKKLLNQIHRLMKNNSLPIVVISGATGTGKTKLSIEIAQHYGGEVINADALQVYKGLDIATNKATETERQGVIHHLLGFKNVEILDFTIHEFQRLTLEKIQEIRQRNKMPIVVGGTNYYLESILWPRLININNSDLNNIESDHPINYCHKMTNDELYEYLKKLDSHSASVLHPNNRRKVWRAIEIALNSEATQFDYLSQQDKSRRFDLNELVFLWISSEKPQLFPRLELRVEQMFEQGLLSELEEIQILFKKLCPTGQYTQGIFQAIGFKEFHDYLNLPTNTSAAIKTEVLERCIDRLKLANKQYSRIQNKWVKNRFLRKGLESEMIPVFKLDSSDVSRWPDVVLKRSIDIIDQVRFAPAGLDYSDFVAPLPIAPEKKQYEMSFSTCYEVCKLCDGQLFVSREQWDAHITSRRHERRRRNQLRREKLATKLLIPA